MPFASVLLALLLSAAPARPLMSIPCSADCDGSGLVGINELIVCLNISLGTQTAEACPACDNDDDGRLSIDDLVVAVRSALGLCHGDVLACCGDGAVQLDEECDDGNIAGGDGCGPDCRFEGTCPVSAGRYTLTQRVGGSLRMKSFSPLPLPHGGALVLDVAEARPPDCVHAVAIPTQNGFTMPIFCVPGTGINVLVRQHGCGIGWFDSNGGSDFTVAESGDSSDASPTCNVPDPNCANSSGTADNAMRVDVRIGDGEADTCLSGTANLLLALPIETILFLDTSGLPYCPAADGRFDADEDTLVARFLQTLYLSSDASSTRWSDLDGDGCAIPPGQIDIEFRGLGQCADLEAGRLVLTAAGPVAAGVGPLFDFGTALSLPYDLGPAVPAQFADCEMPPQLTRSGVLTRCVQ